MFLSSVSFFRCFSPKREYLRSKNILSFLHRWALLHHYIIFPRQWALKWYCIIIWEAILLLISLLQIYLAARKWIMDHISKLFHYMYFENEGSGKLLVPLTFLYQPPIPISNHPWNVFSELKMSSFLWARGLVGDPQSITESLVWNTQ